MVCAEDDRSEFKQTQTQTEFICKSWQTPTGLTPEQPQDSGLSRVPARTTLAGVVRALSALPTGTEKRGRFGGEQPNAIS